ncbi:uncharacterized protein LOC126834045 [Adelges cooleyi]|uniref:uncharacterized protein LOC126834045 n=1 Tax=Adelges cooleyi TaxID=133065 RepID=UPI00217F5F4A|nr:uncharacterized protein LOC126834045 [Adelges cooleyi]
MHFKNAIIVCAVYFLTSAWSIGLNSDQLIQANKRFETDNKCKNGICEEEFKKFVTEYFGIAWKRPQHLGYNSTDSDCMNVCRLLKKLATKDKSSDKLKDKILTPLEVKLYVDEFMKVARSHEQPGYLTLRQLSEVFNYWKPMNDTLKQKSEHLKSGKGEGYVLYVAEFLLIMLDIKQPGKGLTIAQIKKFGILYDAHKTSHSINPKESEKVFNDLGITVNDELKSLFKPDKPVGILLMDLIMAAAERKEMLMENDLRVISPSEVMYARNDFNEYDVSKDGELSPKEYAEFKEYLNLISKSTGQSSVLIEERRLNLENFDGIEKVNFAEFLETVLIVEKHDSAEDSMSSGDGSCSDESQ